MAIPSLANITTYVQLKDFLVDAIFSFGVSQIYQLDSNGIVILWLILTILSAAVVCFVKMVNSLTSMSTCR